MDNKKNILTYEGLKKLESAETQKLIDTFIES